MSQTSVGISDELSPLPWHATAYAQLLKASDSDGALLWVGDSGQGKRHTARVYAQWLLCESAEKHRDAKPCGQCRSCLMIHARQHPDLQVLLPQAMAHEWWSASEDDGGEDTATGERKKASNDIRVEDIRRLSAFAGMGSTRGGVRVVLVYPAQKMNTAASNALLKTLEEPTPGLRFILLCGNAGQVLPTIRSRCKVLTTGPAQSGLARQWLKSAHPSKTESLLASALAHAAGAPFMAAALLEEGKVEIYNDVLTRLLAPQRFFHAELAALMEKQGIKPMGDLMGRLLYDIQRVGRGATAVHFPWLAEAMARLRTAGSEPMQHLERTLTNMRRSAFHPLNPRLVLESCLLSWQDVFH